MKHNPWTLGRAASAAVALTTLTLTLALTPAARAQTVTAETNNIVMTLTNGLGKVLTYTNPEVITVTDWDPATVAVAGDTNASGIQAGLNMVINAVTGNTTNWYGVVDGLYAPKIQQKLGADLGVFYPVSQYVVGGVRFSFIDGGFWMPSGTVTFQVPMRPMTFIGGSWSNVVVSPFAYAGVGLPLSGATIVTTVGNTKIPGKISDNNGEPTAITGAGVVITLWHRSTPTTAWWQPVSLGAIADVEQWSGFKGNQYRFGVECHWLGGKN